MSWLKDIKNLYNLYKEDVEARNTKDAILARGITEDFVRAMVKEADLGTVIELNFPSGAIFRVTRTPYGALTETASNSGVGLSFKESF